MLVGPASPRVQEPVFAGFSLAPTGAVDESDDAGARASVIGLPRGCRTNLEQGPGSGERRRWLAWSVGVAGLDCRPRASVGPVQARTVARW